MDSGYLAAAVSTLGLFILNDLRVRVVRLEDFILPKEKKSHVR